MVRDKLGELGVVTTTAGKKLTIYVTNMSLYELKTYNPSMPSNALIICAYNKSNYEGIVNDLSYRLIATDNYGNICDISMFDEIGNGLTVSRVVKNVDKNGTNEQQEYDELQVNPGLGLEIDAEGKLQLKIPKNSGLILDNDGLWAEANYALKAGKVTI